MTNGDVLDSSLYGGPLTLPTDPEKIDRIETLAEFVLIVEKESVFESLLSRNVFGTFERRFILITGKGYPDCCTRRIVHRLTEENQLAAYILVDADPFGVEIMLVYRHGSKSMSFSSQGLTTPALRWIGLHPRRFPHSALERLPWLPATTRKSMTSSPATIWSRECGRNCACCRTFS